MNKIPILRLENVTAKIGKDLIFKSVSFNVKEFDFVSIKGPSGCGKTTLLRILVGLTKPVEGKIYIDKKLANNPHILIPAYKRQMSILFQDLALWPHMKGEEQLRFVWESTKVGNFSSQVHEICKEIGLPENLLSKYPGELSGGEKQRLAIARTMIANPRVVLLDEPLTALDYNLRELFLRYMKKVRRMRIMTVLIVSHDLTLDMIEVDQVIQYKDGSFREY